MSLRAAVERKRRRKTVRRKSNIRGLRPPIFVFGEFIMAKYIINTSIVNAEQIEKTLKRYRLSKYFQKLITDLGYEFSPMYDKIITKNWQIVMDLIPGSWVIINDHNAIFTATDDYFKLRYKPYVSEENVKPKLAQVCVTPKKSNLLKAVQWDGISFTELQKFISSFCVTNEGLKIYCNDENSSLIENGIAVKIGDWIVLNANIIENRVVARVLSPLDFQNEYEIISEK